MNHDDEEPVLEEWKAVWQIDEPPRVDTLRRRVRRTATMNRLAMILEIVVATGGVIAGLWLGYLGHWLPGAAAGAFGAFGLAVSIATRAGSPDLDLQTVASALETAIAQTRRQQAAALGGLWVCVAALLFVAVVALDAAYGPAASPESLTRLVRVQGAGALFVACALIASILTLVRANRRLARLARLRDDL